MKKKLIIISLITIVSILAMPVVSYAQPYGAGKYNENVPYGSVTSLSISTNSGVNIGNITPTSIGTLGTGSSVITVTSTDVVGYKLYIQALSNTNMDNLGSLIPASATIPPASATPLVSNTWGYNTDASTNFLGITLDNQQIDSFVGPTTAGHNTTVTYGLKVNLLKPAGSYVAHVVYTAAPQTD